jgi:hypothetical protein
MDQEFRNDLVSVRLRLIDVKSDHSKNPAFNDQLGNVIETHEPTGEFREW